MINDNSPMLPRPATDNAPMISGRGTKIIANARGAYLARNLDGILQHMQPEQHQRFRHEVLRQGLRYARIVFENVEQFAYGMRFADAVERWLADPSTEHAAEIDDLQQREPDPPTDPATGSPQYGIFDVTLFYLIWTIHPDTETAEAAGYVSHLARMAGITEYRGDTISSEVFDTAARDAEANARLWQVESAWAILHGRQPPSLPEIAS